MTAARSPSLAASCSLPPSTSPAAAPTGNAESSQVDAGDDPPTATAEPRSLSCNRYRWQHLLPRRAQSSSARHARIAPAKTCGPQCRRCRRKLFSALELELSRRSRHWNWMGHLTIGDPELPRWAASRTGLGGRRPFPGTTGTLQETPTGARPGRAGP